MVSLSGNQSNTFRTTYAMAKIVQKLEYDSFQYGQKIFLESIEQYESQELVLRTTTMAQLTQGAAHVRNCDLTYGGKSLLETATTRKPPDVTQIENMNPGSMTQEETDVIRCQNCE